MSYNDEPQAGGLITWKTYLIPAVIIIVIALFFTFVWKPSSSCGDTVSISGKLISWKVYDDVSGGYILFIENGTFIKDGYSVPSGHYEYWFSDKGDFNFDNFVGKNILLDFMTGCGQSVITNIREG